MRCPQCASDNPPDYRFCGMCGTPLDKPATSSTTASTSSSSRHARDERSSAGARITEVAPPVRTAPPVEEPSQPLSGPSFLGLSGQSSHSGLSSSSHDFKYLLEDEQPKRTYWRFTLIMVVLFALAGLGWLEYSRAGKAWVAPWSKGPAQSPVQASQPQPSDQAQPPAAPPPAADHTAAPKSDNNAPAAANSTTPPAGDSSAMKETVTPKEPDKTAANNKTPEASQTAAKEEKGKSAPDESASAKTPAADDSADTEDTEPVAKAAKPARTPKTKEPSAPAPSEDDALVANAEKYLYGRGVPQNCDRALISLRAAADRSNTRARSLLGSMYATGHCVPRDLPNAYRWFALASRENADNMWVQRNLEMIWREMTPQERQLATQRSQ